MESAVTLKNKIEKQFNDEMITCEIASDQVTMTLPTENIISVCKTLRDDEQFVFAQLTDLCGVDYSSFSRSDWATHETTSTGFSRGRESTAETTVDQDQRFAVVYHLLSIKNNIRLRLRCFVSGEPPCVDSVTDIWSSANWFEREAFDLFGIVFKGHPDLRRILTDYGFIGHPFRKDFPLEGNVELRYDEDKKRVVYEPVTITNRVLVPRVIREDNRFVDTEEEQTDA